MKILFSMRHPGALRNFASTLRALAERGHRVHLVFAKQDKEGDDRLLRDLTAAIRRSPPARSSARSRGASGSDWRAAPVTRSTTSAISRRSTRRSAASRNAPAPRRHRPCGGWWSDRYSATAPGIASSPERCSPSSRRSRSIAPPSRSSTAKSPTSCWSRRSSTSARTRSITSKPPAGSESDRRCRCSAGTT